VSTLLLKLVAAVVFLSRALINNVMGSRTRTRASVTSADMYEINHKLRFVTLRVGNVPLRLPCNGGAVKDSSVPGSILNSLFLADEVA